MSSPNFEPLTPGAASSMDDIFGVKNTTTDILDEFAGPEPTKEVIVEKPKPLFQPKVLKAQQEKTESQKTEAPVQMTAEDIPEDKVTPERLKALEDNIKQLLKGQNGVKLGKVPEKPEPLDFSKLTENDVYDLNIPIEAIDHGVPDYLNVILRDQNYAARWVHRTPRRLGPMMAVGWTYCEQEDIDPSCHLEVTKDENGHFRFDDIILMKLPKDKYFGQLRKNYERSRAQVSSAKLKTSVEKALLNSPSGGNNKRTAADYMAKNQLEVYVPGDK